MFDINCSTTFYDPTTGYNLPTLVCANGTMVCACDMCYSFPSGPVQNIGPHDLHCMCDNCCDFANEDKQFFDSLAIRYPEFESVSPQFDGEDYVYGYCPTPVGVLCPVHDLVVDVTSPTNHTMHALNGNQFHQHHSGNGDFLRAAARGLSRDANSADRFAALGVGWPLALFSGLSYTAHKNLSKPLSELRQQIFGSVEHDPNRWQKKDTSMGPSNKDMHSYNGNWGDAFYGDLREGKGLKLPKLKQTPPKMPPKQKVLPPTNEANPAFTREIADIIQQNLNNLIKRHPEAKSDPAVQEIEEGLHTGNASSAEIKEDLNLLAENYTVSTGPTNKEMHAVNGNIYGPANQGVAPKRHKNQLRRLAKKINKANKKKPTIKIVKVVKPRKNFKKGIAKYERKAGKIEKKELQVARAYARFLKNPVYRPPRLGSTGMNATKILHGYSETTISMSSVNGLTNCTDCIFWISPKMFSFSGGVSNFACPLASGFAINASTAYTNVASTSSITTNSWLNDLQLKNETGVTSSAINVPMSRYLGGHVSIRCRCPMSTTAPPFLFGGLLPQELAQRGAVAPVVDPAAQLNQLTSTQIRALPSTVEIEGFEGSAVYFPASAADLLFNNLNMEYADANIPPHPVAYIGMTGCPTTATVTIIASGFWEMQQTTTNQPYAGWGVGPRVSAEDVFDNLKRFPTVSNRSLNMGAKSNQSIVTVGMITKAKPVDPAVELQQLQSDFKIFRDRFKKLSIITEDSDEDEKFVVASPDTPRYSSLSRSTLDLALQLKDKLTPGSVTSKASRTALP